MQDGLSGILMLYGFHLRCDRTHIPEHGPQALHPVGSECGYVHAVLRSGGLGGKDRRYLPPVRGLARYIYVVIAAGLQILQLVRQLDVDLSHSGTQRYGVLGRFIREQDAER